VTLISTESSRSILSLSLGRVVLLTIFLAAVTMAGCTHLEHVNSEIKPVAYLPEDKAPELAARFAPVFVVNNPHQTYNRIGKPRARLDDRGLELIEIDIDQPVVYYQIERFKTQRASYTNLLYRVHYPSTPASLLPFFIAWGGNPGNFIVITLNDDNQPVLVTTVGTCGCYVAIIPTTALPPDALPKEWTGKPLELYGETLPPLLDYNAIKDSRLMVAFRPGEHRVMSIALEPAAKLRDSRIYELSGAQLLPMDGLERLPLGDGHTSLYYQNGPLYGHVKGAYKPLETVLLGIVSLDFVVGMDKAYGYTENPFYTSIKPWNRLDSDMNNFPRFLRFYGWNL
jgi:hypothetical protein